MPLLPVALNVRDLHCLVVGGGEVAARKARVLLECEAKVHVVSPQLNEELTAMRAQLEYSPRAYQEQDCAEADLVFACTNDSEINGQIARDARARKLWCNIVDDAHASTLHSAAAVRRGEIVIGITTGGGSPVLARHLKGVIGNCVGDEYEQLLKLMSERRETLKKTTHAQQERAQAWRKVLESRVLDLLRDGKPAEAAQELDASLGLRVETDR